MNNKQELNMKRIHLFLILLAGILIGTSFSASAQRIGKWEKLGQRSVNLFVDRDVIYCSHKGAFKTIKFHVMKAPVSFLKVNVKYANGATDNLRFNQLVRAGQDSGELDLRGNKRVIKEIVVYYKTEKKRPKDRHFRREAIVQIWGKH